AVAGRAGEPGAAAAGRARLAEHSLPVVERGTPTRYGALETIRQYGIEQLELAGELDQAKAGHERWCRTAAAALHGGSAQPDDARCQRFDRVADDMRAALDSWPGY